MGEGEKLEEKTVEAFGQPAGVDTDLNCFFSVPCSVACFLVGITSAGIRITRGKRDQFFFFFSVSFNLQMK